MYINVAREKSLTEAANSLNVFHRRLKTYLFTAAFRDKYSICNVASASVS